MARQTPAPLGVLRAARWPLETLEVFGSAELAAAARDPDLDRRSYRKLYGRARALEREALWARTADDPRFMSALLVTNPPLAARVPVLRERARTTRNKRVRHMETTLYRYLARAAGRPTPGGAWAGVGVVEWGEATRVEPALARHAFTPDLRAFQTLLHALSSREVYRLRARLSLNPTLSRRPDGGFAFHAPLPAGGLDARVIEPSPTVDRVLAALEGLPPARVDALAVQLERAGPWDPARDGAARAVLLDLLHGGVLVGGLTLPALFSDGWQALEAVEAQLEPADRAAWRSARTQLHTLADELAASLAELSLARLAARLEAARTLVAELARALQVELEPGASVLHHDCGLPLRVVLGKQAQARLEHALARYETEWVDGASPFSAWRLCRQRARASWLAEGRTPAELAAWLEPEVIPDATLQARRQGWQALLSRDVAEVTLTAFDPIAGIASVKAPLACAYVEPLEDERWVVRGVGDSATHGFARLAPLLPWHPLERWLKQRLAGLATDHDVAVDELAVPFADNPNALARPSLLDATVAPWGSLLDGRVAPWGGAVASLGGARLYAAGDLGPLLLALAGDDRPHVLLCLCSAAVGARDVVVERLLWSGFQDQGAREVRASAGIVPSELEQPRFTPRVRLSDGSVLRPRRTLLHGRVLQALLQGDAPERYRHWQLLAAEHGWPALLRVGPTSRAPVLLPRDSPLALEAMLEGVRVQDGAFIVEEVVGAPWLCDGDGLHYASELALPFARSDHGLSSLSHE